MDLITQGILGAAVSQAGFQKTLGRRALAWGAIAGMIPDMDVFVRLSSNPFAEMLYHRGITHSLWFGPVLGPIFGYLVWKWYQRKGFSDPLSSWIGLMIWALITHPLLDVFTIYGTQLLAPFSNHRFTIPAIAIVDPVYSLTLLAAICVGYFFHKRQTLVTISASIALTLTSAYLFFGLAQNEKAEKLCRTAIQATGENPLISIKAYPTMFQLFLRRLVVEDPDKIRVGFVSTWSPRQILWETLEKPKNLPSFDFLNDPEVEIFKWFTSGQYAIIYEPLSHQITINDTRFGFRGPSAFGLWGIRFQIDQQGNKAGPIERVKYPIGTITGRSIIKLFQETFD